MSFYTQSFAEERKLRLGSREQKSQWEQRDKEMLNPKIMAPLEMVVNPIRISRFP